MEKLSMENVRAPESARLSTPKEYRIHEGTIEARILDEGTEPGAEWTKVSAEQLKSHVLCNTAVARWLERNLGWRRLLRACVDEDPNDLDCKSDDRLHACQ